MTDPMYVKIRGNPLMKQLAALEASRLQYDQVTNVMPQLSAEINTLSWLYSVMNKGEGAMAVMNMNVPERAKAGGVEGIDYLPQQQAAMPPSQPTTTMPLPSIPTSDGKKRKRPGARRRIKGGVLYTEIEGSDIAIDTDDTDSISSRLDYALLNEIASKGNTDAYNFIDSIKEEKESRRTSVSTGSMAYQNLGDM